MHKKRQNTTFKGRYKAMPELVPVENYKLRYRNGKFFKTIHDEAKGEKEKKRLMWAELRKGYMASIDRQNRINELEALLKAPDIEKALSFTRLHYVSNGRRMDAQRLTGLVQLIKKTLGTK